MLWARGALRVDDFSFESRMGFAPTLRIHAVERRGLTWDTRFVPARADEGPGPLSVHVILSGRAEWSPLALTYGPGSAFVASEAHIEGAAGQRELVLRTEGTPFRSIQLRVDSAFAIAEMPSRPEPLAVGPRILDTCERIFADRESELDGTERTRELLRALEHVVSPAIFATMGEDEPAGVTRCWNAVAQHYMRLEPAPSLQELADAAGVSLRQFNRDIEALVERLPVGAARFRDLVTDARLRWAVLLLSAPTLSIARVAEAAGYGSVQALGRAFRDAELLPPSAIRRALTRQ